MNNIDERQVNLKWIELSGNSKDILNRSELEEIGKRRGNYFYGWLYQDINTGEYYLMVNHIGILYNGIIKIKKQLDTCNCKRDYWYAKDLNKVTFSGMRILQNDIDVVHERNFRGVYSTQLKKNNMYTYNDIKKTTYESKLLFLENSIEPKTLVIEVELERINEDISEQDINNNELRCGLPLGDGGERTYRDVNNGAVYFLSRNLGQYYKGRIKFKKAGNYFSWWALDF